MIAIMGNPNVGKTTFLNKLKDENFKVLEVDSWVNEQYKEGADVFRDMVSHFGIHIVNDGKIDKKILKTLIINDFSVLREIELIVHKHLYDFLSQNTYDFVEIPILKWSPIDFTNLFSKVINLVRNPQEIISTNVDNFSESLIDTNNRGCRPIEAVDIYVKIDDKPSCILKKMNILQLPNL